jgi:hypothetical protein
MFGSIFKSVTNTIEDFIDDPLATTANIATQPIRDSCDLLDGLTEGEIRHKAALRLGADIVAGMVIGEVIEALGE